MFVEVTNHDFLMVLDMVRETAMKNEQYTHAATDKSKNVTFSSDQINDDKDDDEIK